MLYAIVAEIPNNQIYYLSIKIIPLTLSNQSVLLGFIIVIISLIFMRS